MEYKPEYIKKIRHYLFYMEVPVFIKGMIIT